MKRFVILVLALAIILTGCGAGRSIGSTIFAMDTYMTLKVFGSEREAALEAAEAEIHRLDRLLSISSQTGEVYAVNTAGGGEVGAEVSALLTAAKEVHERTDGAFDITVLPVMELWGFTSGEYTVPAPDELEEALRLVDGESVELSGNTVTLKNGVRIDLGGIAKGYTSDRVTGIMRDMGVTSAIVTLGGNVQALGSKPDGSDWKVAIRDPANEGGTVGVISVSDMAVVTSGGYERYFEEAGRRYHHIIDPATGFPAETGLASVTIVCADGITADALSTALFVMGLDAAESFWESGYYDFEAVFVTDTGEIYITAGLESRFEAESFTVLGRK